MASTTTGTAGPSFVRSDAVLQLQSHEQAELLDAIDGLRSADVGADINIPSIVVCGDQSSGKSSVLEAIAQVRFPLGSGTTTCFPIEVVLRKDKKSAISVKIRPAPDRSMEHAHHLANFRSTFEKPVHEDFPAIVQEATDYLKAFEPNRSFWNDVLCAEVSGPTQPHLTLVDLPGLIHFQGQNSQAEDGKQIEAMVRQHFNNPRTIVLVVVSALYDLELQRIMTLIKEAGNAKGRTLGVITKPDRVIAGSDEEKRRVQMAGNGPMQLGRGWHVLVNLPHEDEDRSAGHRDELERAFFAQGAWSKLPSEDVGIASLRYKLSRSLLDCIIQDLPRLMSEMERELGVCSNRLTALGTYRETVDDKREYLAEILSKLQRLLEASLDGDYHKAEFALFFDGASEKRLRDIITTENVSFASHIRNDGKQFRICEKPVANTFPSSPSQASVTNLFTSSTSQPRELETGKNPNFDAPYIPKFVDDPGVRSIGIMRYCTALDERIKATRGKNLPGILSENIIQDIFRQQSVFWGQITREHTDRCFGMTFNFVKMAVLHIAGSHTGLKLMQHFVNGKFDDKGISLKHKVEELLWPYEKCHPMTYNTNFEAKIGVKPMDPNNKDHTHEGARRDWADVVRGMSFGNDLLPAARALDRTEVYYDIALDNFIENVASLAVERCLLHDLRSLIQPKTMWGWSEQQLTAIAAEPEDAQRERERLAAKISALEGAVQICKRHMRHVSDDHVIPQAIVPQANLLSVGSQSTTPQRERSQSRNSTRPRARPTQQQAPPDGPASDFSSPPPMRSGLFGNAPPTSSGSPFASGTSGTATAAGVPMGSSLFGSQNVVTPAVGSVLFGSRVVQPAQG